MKNDALKLKRLKSDLYNQRRKCKDQEFIIRQLTEDEVDYVKRFCIAKPHIYKIWKAFRPGYNIRCAPHVIKEIYHSKQNPVFLVLTDKEVEICKNIGLRPIPYKYKIYLNTLR